MVGYVFSYGEYLILVSFLKTTATATTKTGHHYTRNLTGLTLPQFTQLKRHKGLMISSCCYGAKYQTLLWGSSCTGSLGVELKTKTKQNKTKQK